MAPRESYIPTPERIEDLANHYALSPEVIEEKRQVFTTLWYLGLREISPSTLPQEVVRAQAMRKALTGVQGVSRKLLALKPLQIDVSLEDLQSIQDAENNMFFLNHQGFKDIPRTCQMLGEMLGTHSNTHFIMKPSVPAPWIFKAGGGVVLKRGKDLKKEKETGKIDTRGHLLRPEELPPFLGKFLETPGRNIAIYSQGTRAKGDTEEERVQQAFTFRPAVVWAMNEQIQQTPNANHVCIALDYRRKNEVRATIKVLKSGDKGSRKILDTSVNGFLGEVKESI